MTNGDSDSSDRASNDPRWRCGRCRDVVNPDAPSVDHGIDPTDADVIVCRSCYDDDRGSVEHFVGVHYPFANKVGVYPTS